MLYIILSIIVTTALFTIMKSFSIFQVQLNQTIVVNYWCSAALGFVFISNNTPLNLIGTPPSWMGFSVVLSFCFYIMFNLLTRSSLLTGMSITTMANKMSLIIPVSLGIILLNESYNLSKLLGIVVALVGIVFAAYPKKDIGFAPKLWLFPSLIVVGSGFVDFFIKYIQKQYVVASETGYFVSGTFLFCGIIGLIFLLFSKQYKIDRISIFAGILLGIPNFGTIYFLMKALDCDIESGVIFTYVNIGTLVLSTLVAYIFFKERLSAINIIGIFLCLTSILLIQLGL